MPKKIFSQKSRWRNFWCKRKIILGNIIEFVVPPNSALEVSYESIYGIAVSQLQFNDTIEDIMISPTYNNPSLVEFEYYNNMNNALQKWEYIKTTECLKGVARFNITIVFAEILDKNTLTIYADDKNITPYDDTNKTIIYENYVLNATQIKIISSGNLQDMNDSYIWPGFLIRFSGKFVGMAHKPEDGSNFKKYAWVVGVSCGIVVVLLVIVIYTVYKFNSKQKRFDQITDLLKVYCFGRFQF